MTKTGLQKRFNDLGFVLNRSRGLGYFNDGQRTCINMERAAILHAQEQIEMDNVQEAEPEYTIPAHLEAKCLQVLKDFK